MPVELLETKLFPPMARADAVARPRLIRRLDGGLGQDDSRVVLLSAPAGFGKTTLLASWLAERSSANNRAGAVAWVSLDASDRASPSFWTYVVTALERAAPGVGASTLAQLRAGVEPTEGLLAGLLNELSVLPGDVIVALDDYHLADGPAIAAGMGFLVDHLPPQVRLVISTRADPALPLARLRARGELTELRAADLRFDVEESTSYLTETTGLTLSSGDVAALEERTEGWVAALQLAALSLRGRDDPSGFIAGFAGDDRFVVDYLVEEVLDGQPEEVRGFLLATSVLDRLTGPLCDAVTEEQGGGAMLERLDRANLFLVPLDDQRRWYRYHHLFGDLLRSHLLAGDSDVAELHRRASRWYDQEGEPVSAVQHALAAGDVDRAAELVELAVPELRRLRQEGTLRQWVDQLPAAVVDRRPVLAMGLVGALMSSNEFDDIERRLGVIEKVLDHEEDLVVVDETERARLPGGIELYRAGLALLDGHPTSTRTHAQMAVELAPPDDDLTRASAAALVGLAAWTVGDLDAAHRSYTDAADGLGRLGYTADVLGCSVTLADLETTRGLLGQAERTYQAALDLAVGEDPRMRGTRDMHTGLAQLAVERNDLAAAAEHLRRADALGEVAGLPKNPYRWRVALASLREAEGDHDAARVLLAEAERVYVADFAPNVQPVPATRARLSLAMGDLSGALEWVTGAGLSPEDDPTYLREYEYVTLARILLAQHVKGRESNALDDARQLLERLLAAADAGERRGTVIEVLALLALARAADHDDRALEVLERALTLAEPEGYVRVFVGHGDPMVALLRKLTGSRPSWGYPRELLDSVLHERPDARPRTQGGLAEPLTGRERDVLRLLATELDGPAIARELVVSLNTVRTHTKNLYAKLGVTNRRAAITRAHALNLLTRAAD